MEVDECTESPLKEWLQNSAIQEQLLIRDETNPVELGTATIEADEISSEKNSHVAEIKDNELLSNYKQIVEHESIQLEHPKVCDEALRIPCESALEMIQESEDQAKQSLHEEGLFTESIQIKEKKIEEEIQETEEVH